MVDRATVATSPIPRTIPTISIARCGIRRRGGAHPAGSARAGAAPVVGTSKVSTTRALACTAPPSCRSPTGVPACTVQRAAETAASQDGCDPVASFSARRRNRAPSRVVHHADPRAQAQIPTGSIPDLEETVQERYGDDREVELDASGGRSTLRPVTPTVIPVRPGAPHARFLRHTARDTGRPSPAPRARGHVVLDDVSLSVGPAHLPRRRRPERGRQVDPPADPGRPAGARRRERSGWTRPQPPSATSAQEHAHAGDETVSAALNRRAGVAAVETELAAAASGLAAGGPPGRGPLRGRTGPLRSGLGR